MFLQLFQDLSSIHPFGVVSSRPPPHPQTNPSPQIQNDDPFPSHIVDVFSFAHLPFSYDVGEIECYKIYISINLYITFRQSYFSQKKDERSFSRRLSS
jgi:hypothetical protein